MSTINAHIGWMLEPVHLEQLRDLVDPAVRITAGEDIPPDTHILIQGRPTRAGLQATPALHTLIIPFAGLPPETRALMADFPQVAIHNLHHNAPMTAEMALALLLAAAKNLIPVDRAFRQHDWSPRYTGVPENVVLDGKTALILGYGAIGQRVATLCRALGMSVIAVRRRTDADPGVYPLSELPDLLPRTDVLLLCLPETPDTNGLIGAAELALLPPGAIVVNVGRGPVVDEGALYHALKSGHLHAAGLDVWYRYPDRLEAHRTGLEAYKNTPPSAYPFHELDNVVLSPHRAGGAGAHEVEMRRVLALAESLDAAARGESIPHPVDLQAGY